MSTINYTYNVIVDRFRQFAAGHFQLRRFTHGEISQADLEKEAEWPWLHVKPRAINYSPGTRSFSFEIFISDLPRDKEDKTGYQAESITDCSLIFQDLINEIYLGNMFGSDVVLTRPVNAEPFVEQYTHTLTGVTGTIELNLDYDWSACSIPASWNYNTPTDSGTDGWGALQFIESLDQNGAFVSLLNDVEAPGNSYYYGTNASGVKGWYAIVDNVGLTCETLPDCATIISIVDDIAALQTDVALKANTADLGATAFSNSYNDLDNLPTIPAQYNPTAGTGVSITGTYPNQTITNTAPDQTVALTAGTGIGVSGTYPNFTITNSAPSSGGTVTSVAALTLGTTGTDLSSTVANSTSTPVITLNVPTASATNRGALSAADWSTFNGKFTLPSLTSGSVLFSNGTTIAQDNANLFWDDTNNRLGIGTASPSFGLDVNGTARVSGNITGGTAINATTSVTAATFMSAGLTTNNNGARYILNGSNLSKNWHIANNWNVGGGFEITSSTANGGNTFTTPNFVIAGATGNVLINTNTDAGYKLDVNGTARIQNNFFISSGFAIASLGNTVNLRSNLAGGSGYVIDAQSYNTLNSANNEQGFANFSGTYAPTSVSGTPSFNALKLIPTINQTGGANGITRGLYINPTLTAAADFRAIETTAGNVMLNTTSGNTLIGTTTNAGYKLDVNGTARVSGNLTCNSGFFIVDNNKGYLSRTTTGSSVTLLSIDSSNNTSFGSVFQGQQTLIYSTTHTVFYSYPSSVIRENMRIMGDSGNVLIGTNTDIVSSILTLASTTKGFLPPRMTNAQMLAITSPAAGLVVYDTTNNKHYGYNGTTWNAFF